MRTTSFLAAALLAFTHTVAAAVNLELYPDSENCTGRKIVLSTTGCQAVLIRGSAKVVAGGVWGYYGAGCTGQMVGVFTPAQGCFTTYPGYFSWNPFDH